MISGGKICLLIGVSILAKNKFLKVYRYIFILNYFKDLLSHLERSLITFFFIFFRVVIFFM
jgi:hypothetical protein